MKGSAKVIAQLNILLADELTAVNQYMVHSEMCANWGYDRLHRYNEKRAIDEMKHAETLIARILFFDGQPIVSNLNAFSIGQNVPAQLSNDHDLEASAIKLYNESIALTFSEGDAGTREILEDILEDEEEHIDWFEEQLDQIEQMGLNNYLEAQIKE